MRRQTLRKEFARRVVDGFYFVFEIFIVQQNPGSNFSLPARGFRCKTFMPANDYRRRQPAYRGKNTLAASGASIETVR